MLQTLLRSWMNVPRKFLNIPLAVLAETPATYILTYCKSSTAFTAVHCFQFNKKVLELNATLDQSSDRTVKHLCLWLQNEQGRQFCEKFVARQGGENNNETHAYEPTFLLQNKIYKSRKLLRSHWRKESRTFSELYIILYKGSIFCDNFILHCLSYNSVHRHEHHFVVINKGARQFYLNSATRYCTIQITFSWIWSNVPQDALRYIKMYVAGVSVKTERACIFQKCRGTVRTVIRLQIKVWSNLQCF